MPAAASSAGAARNGDTSAISRPRSIYKSARFGLVITWTDEMKFFGRSADLEGRPVAKAEFRGVSEGDMVRYAIAKPEPLRTEHEAFRDAVLGKPADVVTMAQGLATVAVFSDPDADARRTEAAALCERKGDLTRS